MLLLTNNGTLTDDRWRHLGDDEPVPTTGPVAVSWARWQRAEPTLFGRHDRLGLHLPNTIAPQEIGGDIEHFALIVLNFPKFTDGRAYSQARLLRTRYGYAGELRAEGDVLRDQLLFMKRCGFDSFVVGERAVREDWSRAFSEFDVFYQPALDGRPSVMRQRLVSRAR